MPTIAKPRASKTLTQLAVVRGEALVRTAGTRKAAEKPATPKMASPNRSSLPLVKERALKKPVVKREKV